MMTSNAPLAAAPGVHLGQLQYPSQYQHQQQQQQQQQQQSITNRRESVPAPCSSLYPNPIMNTTNSRMNRPLSLSSSFSGPFGRIPNFSSSYLTSLNSANSFEQAPNPPTPMMMVDGQQHQPQQQQQQQALTLTPMSVDNSLSPDAFLSGATVVTNTAACSSISAATTTAAGAGTTVVTATSSNNNGMIPPLVITTPKSGPLVIRKNNKRAADRRRSMPSSIVLSPAQLHGGGNGNNGPPPTHPVPEFLCHLYSMLSDPALSNHISWIVPAQDEPAEMGGGKANIGKIAVHDPTRLQNEVLGRYYRHSKYASFQRQLNYFGFKKRLHGGKKGKLSPCSFVHDTLGTDPQSLLNLKRRPPSHKRVGSEATLNSIESSSPTGASSKIIKKGRPKKNVKRVRSSPMASAPYPMAMACNNQNATWIMNGQPIVPRPLNMPIMAQAPWPAPAPAVNAFPIHEQILHPGGCQPVNDQDRVSNERNKNNAAVLEAKRSLQENFLKSHQDNIRRGSPPGNNNNPLPVVENVVNTFNGAVVQQQQQMINMMPAPNRFPNPKNVRIVDDTRVQMQPQTINGWTGQVPMEKNWVFESAVGIKSNLLFPPGLGVAPQAVPNNDTSPIGVPAANNNNNTPASVSGDTTTTDNMLSNSLMGPSTMQPTSVFAGNNNNDYESHPQGVANTPEIMFNDLLLNLLSTSLPPSEELFDDDLSTGNMSDFGATALQVADDGMLLPP